MAEVIEEMLTDQALIPPLNWLADGHNFYFSGSWGMWDSEPYSSPKSNPLTKELGMRNLPDAPNWAVTEVPEAELGDVRRTTRLRWGARFTHPGPAPHRHAS